ncbi:putative receptor-like protein kinase [Hibiscus syriacus]|uniref:Receptor-like protein kinase n=1 Tax=Hibiscus syriacus TaxID=106335 RepID=A0A6A2WSU4_HIBSY|nr:putative receptor-like protein kinase [Hibiscus syriacus]
MKHKHHNNLYPNPNRSNRAPQNRKNRSPTICPPLPPSSGSRSRFEKENVHVDLGSSDRLGPDSGAIPTQIQLTESNNKNGNYKFVPVSFYAGSAFITSPPPSSVPMPAFFTKMAEVSVKNNDATSDLRRILRLD